MEQTPAQQDPREEDTPMSLDTSQIEHLFALSLASDYESEECWEALHTLRRNGSREIFERAAQWCESNDFGKRSRGCAILAQLAKPSDSPAPHARPEYLFRDESFALITRMLSTETEAPVLSSALSALGHLGNEEALPILLSYLEHPDADVRHDLAFALGHFSNHPAAVSGLLKLASDLDEVVRDWAVFGLAIQSEHDSPELRECLLRSLSDSDQEVREQAAEGLAKRADLRLLPWLDRTLQEPELTSRVADAAAMLLGLPEDNPDWDGEDYRRALHERFPSSDSELSSVDS
jgi:HEAT repeat protein